MGVFPVVMGVYSGFVSIDEAPECTQFQEREGDTRREDKVGREKGAIKTGDTRREDKRGYERDAIKTGRIIPDQGFQRGSTVFERAGRGQEFWCR